MACCSACARTQTMGALAGDCDSFLTVVTPSVADELKVRLDPEFRATDAAVRACVGLSSEERATWTIFMQGWATLRDTPAGFWTAKGQWDGACAMARTLEGWRKTLAERCVLPGPKPDDVPANPWPSTLKWAAVAVGLVAVVAGARMVLR